MLQDFTPADQVFMDVVRESPLLSSSGPVSSLLKPLGLFIDLYSSP